MNTKRYKCCIACGVSKQNSDEIQRLLEKAALIIEHLEKENERLKTELEIIKDTQYTHAKYTDVLIQFHESEIRNKMLIEFEKENADLKKQILELKEIARNNYMNAAMFEITKMRKKMGY